MAHDVEKKYGGTGLHTVRNETRSIVFFFDRVDLNIKKNE